MKSFNFATNIRVNLSMKQSNHSFNENKSNIMTNPQTRLFHTNVPLQKKLNVGWVAGKFPFDTYIDAKGFHINPLKKEDKSANITLVKIPPGYQEFKEEADRWGFHNLFKSGDSYFAVSFSDDFPSSMSIEQIAHQKNQIFFDKYPEGQVSPLSLHKDVTEHLKHVEFRSFVMEAGTKNPNEDSFGKMIIFLKTPGGVWDLGWHSVKKNLHDSNHQLGFVTAIKNFKIVLKEPEETPDSSKVMPSRTMIPDQKINRG